MRALGWIGVVLLVLGVLAVAGAAYAQSEVARQCGSQQAQAGLLVGHPDAQACRTYPPLLGNVQLGGLALAAGGAVLVFLGRR